MKAAVFRVPASRVFFAAVLATGAAAAAWNVRAAGLRAPSAAGASVTNTKTSPAKRPVCREETFADFLREFERNVVFQRRRVADPFQDQHVEAFADPEPGVVTQSRRVRDVAFPIYPDPQAQRRERLALKVEIKGSEAVVHLSRPDTDYQYTYRFAKRPCWALVGRADDSL